MKLQSLNLQFLKRRIRQNSHPFQFIQCPIKYIQINFFLYTGKYARIGMLPKLPFTLISNRINIIMGNPIWIRIKYRIVQITKLKFIRCIKNRFYTIMFLYFLQPCLYPFTQFLCIIPHFLDIKYWWEISRFLLHRTV